MGLRRVSLEEIPFSAEYIIDPAEAGGRHGGGGRAVAGGHPAEIEGLFDVLRVAHAASDPGRLLGAKRKQVPDLQRIEPEQRAGGGARAKCAAEAVCAA